MHIKNIYLYNDKSTINMHTTDSELGQAVEDKSGVLQLSERISDGISPDVCMPSAESFFAVIVSAMLLFAYILMMAYR